MKGFKVMAALMIVLLAAPMLITAFAEDPVVGSGVLSRVEFYDDDTYGWYPVPLDALAPGGSFKVIPGETYRVFISDIDRGADDLLPGVPYLPTTVSVWIKGSLQDGTPWTIELTGQNMGALMHGKIESSPFTIPVGSGCTATVSYGEDYLLAREPFGTDTPGHLKSYYPATPEGLPGGPISCQGTGVPEIPFGPEVLSALGLLALSVITRKRSKK